MQCTGVAGIVTLTKQSIPATAVIANVPPFKHRLKLAGLLEAKSIEN